MNISNIFGYPDSKSFITNVGFNYSKFRDIFINKISKIFYVYISKLRIQFLIHEFICRLVSNCCLISKNEIC